MILSLLPSDTDFTEFISYLNSPASRDERLGDCVARARTQIMLTLSGGTSFTVSNAWYRGGCKERPHYYPIMPFVARCNPSYD